MKITSRGKQTATQFSYPYHNHNSLLLINSLRSTLSTYRKMATRPSSHNQDNRQQIRPTNMSICHSNNQIRHQSTTILRRHTFRLLKICLWTSITINQLNFNILRTLKISSPKQVCTESYAYTDNFLICLISKCNHYF